MSKAHIIETALFDISFGCEEDAFEQQAELGSFFRRALLPLVDELFSEKAGGDKVLRIETLELDLGVVSYSEYEDELPRRLREELGTILAGMRFAGQSEATPGSKQLSQSNNERQQVEYFLRHGYLPWYATLKGEVLEAALKQLVATDAGWFAQFIAQSPSPATIIARVTLQFPSEASLWLVQRLSPAHGAMAATLAGELKIFWQGYIAAVQRPPLRLDELLQRFWYLTITALLGMARSLTTQQFFERVMNDLIQHDLNLKQNEIAELIAAVAAGVAASGSQLNSAMRHLFAGATTAARADEKQMLQSGVEDEPPLHEMLVQALTGGSVAALTPLWARLLNDAPLLESLLRHHGQHSDIRNRIAFDFPENFIRDIVRILEPVEHGFVIAVVEDAGLFRGESGTDSPAEAVSRKQLWQFSLGYLLVERGSRFNRKAYLGSLIRQMAAHENMSYRQLLAEIRHTVAAVPGSSLVAGQMRQLLSELGDELGQEFTGTDDRPTAADDELLESCGQFDSLRAFFASGGAGQVDESLLSSAIDNLAQRHPWLLLQLYRQLQAGVTAWQAALNRLSAALLQKFITSFLGLMQAPDLDGRYDLLDAIRANAARSRDLKSYYRQLLSSLLCGEMIDFDAIMRKSSVATTEPERSASEEPPQPVIDEVEGRQGFGEVDITQLRQFLSSDEKPSTSGVAVLLHTFELLAQRQPDALARLLASMLLDKRAMARLIDLLPERLLARCLPLLRMNEHGRLLQCAELVTSACYLNVLVAEPALLPRLKWQFIFSYLSRSGRIFNEHDFVQHYVDYLIGQLQQRDEQEFRAHLSQQLVQNILPSTRDATIRIIEVVTKSEAPSRQRERVPERTEPPAAPTRRKDHEQHEEPPQENIYITNAGLVLAAPYLPRLFQMLKLTDNGAFINRDAAVRAAHMLQFLVNGQSASPEYLLLLNKLLCGIKSGNPIELGIEISADEKTIIEGLLQGMIQNWKVLGNTSIAGLRESFLQREGRLQLRDDAWQLLVEPRAFDMLLDQIPWGYSTIKYPWMERVIYVEWR